MSVALTGTYLEKMNEALRFSERNRARVVTEMRRLVDDLRWQDDVRSRLSRTPPASDAVIAANADIQAGKDPRIKSAVDNEQWGYRLTTMYALAELVAAQREANLIAKRQLVATQKQTDLLTELLHAVTGDNNTIPHQRSGT